MNKKSNIVSKLQPSKLSQRIQKQLLRLLVAIFFICTGNLITLANGLLPYNFESVQAIPIKLTITETISTKNGLIEGQEVTFKSTQKVRYNGKTILKQGEIVKARIETVISSGMNGFPAEIILDNFEIPGIKNTQLISTYTEKGTNRCYWVYPLKWALTPIPLAGSFTNLIKGGHAKITPKDTVLIYYFPEWI